MATLFSHAGVSRKAGKLKVRWANGIERVKMLVKDGQTDIDLIELMHPMTKEDATLALINMNFAAGNQEVADTLIAEAVKRALPGYEKAKTEKPAEAPAVDDAAEIAAIEAEIQANIEVIDLAAEEDNVVDLNEVAEVTRPAVDAFTAWAEAAAAEEAAEEEAA